VALLGLLGAILGLKGYNEQGKNDKYPEFYEKLNNIKIAIVPLTKYNGIFSKKIQVFNNSVGYASQEQGNNLIIREQWLENPRWKIFINLESKVETNLLEKLEDYLINSKAIYIPYLGKNDHYANISNVELLELKN
jgi:CRISPR-associated protein, Cas5h family